MKTGGHIAPCKVGEVEQHNSRAPEYLARMEKSKHPLHIHPELSLHPNEEWSNTTRSEYLDDNGNRMTVSSIFDRMIERYKEKDKRHRRPPLKDRERVDPETGKVKVIAGWSPIREMIVITKSDTQLSEFEKVKEWFAHHGVNVISSSCHFDEGWVNKETGAWKCNNHAHMVLDFFDWETGKTIKLGKAEMEELQDVLADALGMKRGELKEITAAEHMNISDMRKASAEKEAAKAEERLANAIEKEQQLAQKKNDGMFSRIFSSEKDQRIIALEGEVEKWQDMWQSMYKDYLAIKPAAEMGRKLAENARQKEREKVREEIDTLKKSQEAALKDKNTEIEKMKETHEIELKGKDSTIEFYKDQQKTWNEMNQNLEKEKKGLEEKNKNLKSDNDHLKSDNDHLKNENEKLIKEANEHLMDNYKLSDGSILRWEDGPHKGLRQTKEERIKELEGQLENAKKTSKEEKKGLEEKVEKLKQDLAYAWPGLAEAVNILKNPELDGRFMTEDEQKVYLQELREDPQERMQDVKFLLDSASEVRKDIFIGTKAEAIRLAAKGVGENYKDITGNFADQIKEIAWSLRKGTDLVKDSVVGMAACLMVGYNEGVSAVASQCGGGGGQPTGGWRGKDKDEDNRKFFGRCLSAALGMMPQKKKGLSL